MTGGGVQETAYIPTDGGWGWVVVFGSFLVHVVADGITYSFGLMIVEFLDTFQESKGFTSWVISIMIGLTLGSGPIASAVTNLYGCRAATMAGSVIAAAGAAGTYFATSVAQLMFSIGVVMGIGLGLMYCPAIIVVTIYFERYRALATGMAVCGAGIGTFAFAPFTSYLIETYSWRGSFLIYSGIILNCAVFGALFRPPPVRAVAEKPETEAEAEAEADAAFNASILETICEEDKSGENPKKGGSEEPQQPPKKAAMELPRIVVSQHGLNDIPEPSVERQLMKALSERHVGKPEVDSKAVRSLSYIPPVSAAHSGSSLRRRAGAHEAAHAVILSRKDVFYSGSLMNIPEYRSNPQVYRSSTSVHKSPSISVEAVDASGGSRLWSELRRTLTQMVDVSLLSDPVYVLFIISNFLTSAGLNAPLIFIPDRAEHLGVEKQDASWLLAVFGIANTIGRFLVGWMSDQPWANRLLIYNLSLSLCGLSTMGVFLCTEYVSMVVFALFYGLTLSSYISLTSVILVDLLGIDKLTNAFGLLLLFEGIASLIGPPIAGWIVDYTGNYDDAFYFAGALILASGLILFTIPLVRKRFRLVAIPASNQKS